ncbi:MAG TPA: hypothetical protein VIR02_05875 [Anaerolineales bacterium]
MDYILQLRLYIGHRPILMVGAAVLILDQQNRLLMMKRSDIGRIQEGIVHVDKAMESIGDQLYPSKI